MTERFDRRRFLASSLTFTASTSLIGSPAIVQSLFADNAAERVFKIVQEHFSVSEADRGVIQKLTASLRNDFHSAHCESGSDCKRMMDDTEAHEEFATYVVQEFIVSTNYLHILAGTESKLCLKLS